MNRMIEKLKETLMAVLPVTVIVTILHFTLTPADVHMLLRFYIGASMIVIGLAVFLLGVDLGVTPIGKLMGNELAKSDQIWIIAIAGLLLGFFVSIAEPDLHILAGQVDLVTDGVIAKMELVAVVSVGIASLLVLGFIRILYNMPLYKILLVLYLIIFVLAIFSPEAFIAISFDASGATTGAFAVPFILALSIGISALKKDSKASEKDSFGLVAIISTGAVITALIMGNIVDLDGLAGSLNVDHRSAQGLLKPFIDKSPVLMLEALIALTPLVVLFITFQFIRFKLPRRQFVRILKGLLYALIGLILFLVGVSAGFMSLGHLTGYQLARMDQSIYLILIAFALGLVTILAEPAVYVLTKQIEDVTSGYINRRLILTAFSIGVGLAVALSVIRVLVADIKLWHYLLPGYAVALGLMFIAPKLFVGIAFDSGGVASGPMTATFILAFIQGAAEASAEADMLADGFGMIAMVAMMPIITIQLLGLVYKMKTVKEGV